MKTTLALAKLVSALAVLAGCSACDDGTVDSGVDPSQPAVVRASPDHSVNNIGALVTVAVLIDNGFDVDIVQYRLLFNDTLLDFEGPALEGSYLMQGGRTTVFNVTTPNPGEIVVVQIRDGNAPGAAGTGALASFQFRTTASGTAAFGFSGASVKDPDGDSLPASFVAASISIL